MILFILGFICFAIIESFYSFPSFLQTKIFAFLTIIFLILIVLAFSKKGFIFTGQSLFKAYFFNKKLLFKKKIEIKDKSIVTLLTSSANQKLSFSILDNIDTVPNFSLFKIHLLNKGHTKKDLILSLKNKEKAKNALDFLTTNLKFNYEKYNPRRK